MRRAKAGPPGAGESCEMNPVGIRMRGMLRADEMAESKPGWGSRRSPAPFERSSVPQASCKRAVGLFYSSTMLFYLFSLPLRSTHRVLNAQEASSSQVAFLLFPFLQHVTFRPSDHLQGWTQSLLAQAAHSQRRCALHFDGPLRGSGGREDPGLQRTKWAAEQEHAGKRVQSAR